MMAKWWKERDRRRWITKQLINKYGGRCANCGETCNLVHEDKRQATIDHILPLSAGGVTLMSNLQLLCAECNYLKADSLPDTLDTTDGY
jgi:5-methylcytosine-specific restriction endonuclease McrA